MDTDEHGFKTMNNMKVYFDSRCGLCVTLARWLEGQRQLVPVRCVPKNEGLDDLIVVADSGEYWRGDEAWLMVIWALDGYREWAYRLASPTLLPLARQMFVTLSENRAQVSKWFGLKADEELAARLREVPLAGCRR